MFDHASHDCISTFLLTEKMQVVFCDVTMVTISRGESQGAEKVNPRLPIVLTRTLAFKWKHL